MDMIETWGQEGEIHWHFLRWLMLLFAIERVESEHFEPCYTLKLRIQEYEGVEH